MKVNVVQVEGQAALVETSDGRRVVIPRAFVDANHDVSADVLDVGIAYGIPWEELLALHASPADLARELRARGLFTAQDVQQHPQEVFSAIQSVYAVDVATVLRVAAQFSKGR